LYVTITGSAWERPIKTLKGFDRIVLAEGEERQICFELPVDELAVWDNYRGCFFVETGKCKVSIGSSSNDIRLTGSFDIQGETFSPRKIAGHIYAERFDDYYECFLHEKRGSSIPAVFGRQDTGHLNYAQTHFTGTDYNISWIKFSSLDFENGHSHFSAIVQGAPGSRLEIRLREPEGELAGSIEVPNTSEISSYELNPLSPRRRPFWAYAETKLEKISGVHDVYLVLYGKTGIWRFEFR
jgi:beta-glucosidase